MSPIIHIMNITSAVGPAMDHPENDGGSEELLMHKRLNNLLKMKSLLKKKLLLKKW